MRGVARHVMADMLCPVVVGRDAELRTLTECLAAAASRRGWCVFLTGEPGIGKSRLVREVRALVEGRGAFVVMGRCVAAGASVPYRPLTEALLQALRGLPLRDDPGLDPWRPALAAIIPGFAAVAAGAEVSAAVTGEAVIQLLGRLAPAAGLVVVLEDLHWADPDTVAAVEYVSDNVGNLPVVCVVTVRSEPPSPALALARRQRGKGDVVQLPLDRLAPAQTVMMIRACTPDAGADLVARVQRDAEGVPLLVEDVLASPGVPRSFADTVRERLGGLTPAERAVIEAAAVLGRDFDWELLAPMTGLPAESVSAGLERGVECLLLAASGGTVRFRHALTREAVLERVLPPRHRQLAASALSALDAAHPAGEGWRDLAADLAARSGDTARAGSLLTASGEASLRRGALATAIATLRRAVDLLEHQQERSRSELALLEAMTLAGRVDEAAALGARLIGRLGSDPMTLGMRAEVHLRLAQAAVAASRWQMARHQLGLARGLAGDDPAAAVAARIALLESEIAFAGDDTGLARRLADGVAASPGVNAETRCHALEIVGRADRFGDLAAARSAFEQALATAEAAGLPIWRIRALHEIGTIDMFDHAGTERLLAARREAVRAGALSTSAILGLQLSATYTCRWQLAEVDTHARSALEIAEYLGLGQVKAKALAVLAGTCSMRVERGQMENYLARCRSAAPDDAMLEGFAWGSRGLITLLDGDLAAAVPPFGRGMAVLARLPHAEPAAMRAVWPLLLAAVRDRRAAAAIDEARRLGVGAFGINRALIGYAEAVLAGQAGDRDRAETLAVTADAGFVNCEPWGDLARLLAAEAALRDGWGEPRRWLAASRDGFAGRGLDQLAGRCDRLLAAAQPNPWAKAGVTAREADVLWLVADGLSNKQIAARLRISPRTAEKHIESLLRKTSARSRTELAVLASPRPRRPGRSLRGLPDVLAHSPPARW